MNLDYYLNQTEKTQKSFDKYLKVIEPFLSTQYGKEKTHTIIEKSKQHYREIIPKMPYFNSTMYDQLIVTCAKMMVLKKGIKDEGIGVEEFVRLMVQYLRKTKAKAPKVLLNFGGKVFLSKLMRGYLKKVAKQVTSEGWPTEVVDGYKNDPFEMKVCTKECQMVAFMQSVGEEDITPYCSFADFANAETMGYSLKQTSTIDSGVCTFCFNKKGQVHWPESIEKIIA